jgi:hypothetical protein
MSIWKTAEYFRLLTIREPSSHTDGAVACVQPGGWRKIMCTLRGHELPIETQSYEYHACQTRNFMKGACGMAARPEPHAGAEIADVWGAACAICPERSRGLQGQRDCLTCPAQSRDRLRAPSLN